MTLKKPVFDCSLLSQERTDWEENQSEPVGYSDYDLGYFILKFSAQGSKMKLAVKVIWNKIFCKRSKRGQIIFK